MIDLEVSLWPQNLFNLKAKPNQKPHTLTSTLHWKKRPKKQENPVAMNTPTTETRFLRTTYN